MSENNQCEEKNREKRNVAHFTYIPGFWGQQGSSNLSSLGLSGFSWVNITTVVLSSSAPYTLPEISSLLILSLISCLNPSTDCIYLRIEHHCERILILSCIFCSCSNSLCVSMQNKVANSATGLNQYSSSVPLTASSSARVRMEFITVHNRDVRTVIRFPGHRRMGNLSMPVGWIVPGTVPAEIVPRTCWTTGFLRIESQPDQYAT